MDARGNESLSTRNLAQPHGREGKRLSETIVSPDVRHLASIVECQAARVMDYGAEMREAKVRELQEAVKSGAYHVTAERLADEMLRDTLPELLP